MWQRPCPAETWRGDAGKRLLAQNLHFTSKHVTRPKIARFVIKFALHPQRLIRGSSFGLQGFAVNRKHGLIALAEKVKSGME